MTVYLMRIVCLSILYGICRNILGQKGSADRCARLVFGILFCFTVISPLLRPGSLNFSIPDISLDAERIAAQGQNAAEEAERSIIISRTESYILDKAAALGLSVQVQLSLQPGTPPVPASVILTGKAPLQSKQALCEIISSTLGIAKENIQWAQ